MALLQLQVLVYLYIQVLLHTRLCQLQFVYFLRHLHDLHMLLQQLQRVPGFLLRVLFFFRFGIHYNLLLLFLLLFFVSFLLFVFFLALE